MPLPPILAVLARSAMTSAVSSAIKGTSGGGGGGKRRRKTKLTMSDKLELSWIKNTLGKTAASEALPFYMGRR